MEKTVAVVGVCHRQEIETQWNFNAVNWLKTSASIRQRIFHIKYLKLSWKNFRHTGEKSTLHNFNFVSENAKKKNQNRKKEKKKTEMKNENVTKRVEFPLRNL